MPGVRPQHGGMCLGEVARVRAVPAAGSAAGSLVVDAGERTTIVSGLLLERAPDVGEWVLAHAGYALAILTDADAAEALAFRERMGKGAG